MARMYDRPTLGPDGWVVDETPTPAALAWSLDASGNPVGLVGPDGSTISVPQILAQSGVPIGIAPSGTMGANGAVTLGTALNVTYSGGLWLYLPAGAAYAGSVAGFYWTVMSSTTVGTVYGNTYTPGTNSPNIPASPTPIVAAGPGAFVGSTAEITIFQSTLPGGALGNNGIFSVRYRDSRINTAGAKTIRFKLAGTNIVLSNTLPNTASSSFVNSFQNMGRVDYQSRVDGVSDTTGGSTNTISQTAINTAVDQTVSLTLQLAVATDWAIATSIGFEVRNMS